MAVWLRTVSGWVRKGSAAIADALGFGSTAFGESPFGDPE